ncbi:GntR family transcriptional regulator [Streptomyces olivaceoviridis]|uniref:GntR family transcriptional regulator n=1 Tax=Streptomyces olivaceoviridis TaxID=1921 RepID=UPI0036BE3B9F
MPTEPQPARPRYQQIADELRHAIETGQYPPGAKIPGENKLMEEHGVARNTARQALAVLRDLGLTEARKGSGIYVRAFRPIRRNAVSRLSQEQWGSGRSIWAADLDDRPLQTVDIEVVEVEAPDRIATVLELPAGSRVWRRSRTFVVDGEPVNRAVSYLPADVVAGSRITEVDTGPGGTYARLAELGYKPTRFREEIRVRMPLPDEADTLQLPPATPVILVARIAVDERGRVVEVNEMAMNSSRYILEYDFTS